MFFTSKKRREYKASLQKRQEQLDALADALAVRETELTEKEAHINDLVRARLEDLIQDISRREYLASTRVFQQIRTAPNLSRLRSAMTHDMKILRPFEITAHFKGKSDRVYKTTLENCQCDDFKNRKAPCKHMYRLATEVGALLSKDFTHDKEAFLQDIAPVLRLSQEAKERLQKAETAEKRAKQQEIILQNILNEKNLDFPWLSKQYTKFIHDKDTALEQALRIKQHPAYVAADNVQTLKNEHAAAIARCKTLEAKLELYRFAIPLLNSIDTLPPKDVYRAILKEDIPHPTVKASEIIRSIPQLPAKKQKLVLLAIRGMLWEEISAIR